VAESYSIDWSQFGENAALVQSFYELYRADPALVDSAWQRFFSEMLTGFAPQSNGHAAPANGHSVTLSEITTRDANLAMRATKLVENFRRYGHLKANFNPLTKGIEKLPDCAHLEINFSESELSSEVPANGFHNHNSIELRKLISELRSIYCGSIGFEVDHLMNDEERGWLLTRIEGRFEQQSFSREQKENILKMLLKAEAFESELNKKYVGQTRFSSEGGESLMPMLDLVREEGPRFGVSEVLFGMAHRARLNVLLNILGKPLEIMLAECDDRNVTSVAGSGDVKYHMGFDSTYTTAAGANVRLLMAPNPSHLEFVNPIVEGMTRGRQDLKYERDRKKALALLIHGDAAFIGQGIVVETINLCRVPGYTTGGTLHIVINNQVGFTTNPEEGKSTTYCTDMAKAVGAPVFHVNGDDPEACCWVTRLALEFRERFQRDVIIDLVCYRKYGHNEGDDPTFTQPLMYSEVKSKTPVARLYQAKLAESYPEIDAMAQGVLSDFKAAFDQAHSKVSQFEPAEACLVHGKIKGKEPVTSVAKPKLEEVANSLITYPSGFTIHPKLKTILEKRVKSFNENSGIDWGFAEVLAFGSLVLDGYSVRLSGQDCGRGTFGQRHLLLTDFQNGSHYKPFTQLKAKNDASFAVFNSPLSESGVMGFEFGYSSIAENTLTLWEAQYGDFVNGAQVIVDQFIANSEQAWGQLSGLVLLLPHGFEGQGPEHSSARLERFLQQASEGNFVVCYPSSSAQHFHMLRRQAFRPVKRPLIVMTPKSLLRSPSASSKLEDFTSGSFKPLLRDDFGSAASAKALVLLSGKIYHDLVAELKKQPASDFSILRVEELYPLPKKEILKAISDSPKAKRIIWAQEEPQNMGAWTHIRANLEELQLEYVGRPSSASTATGSHKRHAAEQREIVNKILSLVKA